MSPQPECEGRTRASFGQDPTGGSGNERAIMRTHAHPVNDWIEGMGSRGLPSVQSPDAGPEREDILIVLNDTLVAFTAPYMIFFCSRRLIMRLLGHGVDIIDIVDFDKLLSNPEGGLTARCYTQQEIATASDGAHRSERLAARFAAKEAVLKSLGTGWVTGIRWTDIEVHSATNGAPSISVSGEVERIAQERGVSAFFVSLSHSRTVVVASVIAVGEGVSNAPV